MSKLINRRRFLSSAAASVAVAGAWPVLGQDVLRTPTTAPGKKLKIGIVGVGGRGYSHVREIAAIGNANVIALCDVDSERLASAATKIPAAARFADFREMLRLPGLEAVVVSTPDHTHAVATAAALRAGKHVYCEKPLTHTVAEARAITKLAGETGLVTQLGIQIHALDNYRRVVELIRAGAIGTVDQVHIWHERTNRPIDATPTEPPATLDYDLWLGPVPHRPYLKGFHPYNWRRWWAFGSGLLGDIGAHFMDVAFWALDLRTPSRVEASGPAPSAEFTEAGVVAKYEFPARDGKPAVRLAWYDAPSFPPIRSELKIDEKFLREGVLFVGQDGMLFTNYQRHILLPQEQFRDFKRPTTTIASSPGHQQEWINACLAGDPQAASCPFSYGGPLTEAALLGTIAYRCGKPLEWDAQNLRFPNAPEAERHLSSAYREGWTLS